jgi:Protein of unknown function (DUF3325)
VPEGVWLMFAFLFSLAGMGWFALALDAHWQQVYGPDSPGLSTRRFLRVLGTIALAVSLILSFRADHASMAPLVWIMGLAAAALVIALLLAWWPRALRMWMPAGSGRAQARD